MNTIYFPYAPSFEGWRQVSPWDKVKTSTRFFRYRLDGAFILAPLMPDRVIREATGHQPALLWPKEMDPESGTYAVYEPEAETSRLNPHHSKPHPFFTRKDSPDAE